MPVNKIHRPYECTCRNCCQSEKELRQARHNHMVRITGRGNKYASYREWTAYQRRAFRKLHPILGQGGMSRRDPNRPKMKLNRRLGLKKIGTYRWQDSMWKARKALRALANRQT